MKITKKLFIHLIPCSHFWLFCPKTVHRRIHITDCLHIKIKNEPIGRFYSIWPISSMPMKAPNRMKRTEESDKMFMNQFEWVRQVQSLS